jgi:hypothetical protein
MYILLRSKVTIYILYDKKPEGDDDKPTQPVITNKAGSESIRAQLGTFVCPLGKYMKNECPYIKVYWHFSVT